MMPQLDIVIVGAGAAGIGMALTLQKLPGLKYCVLESGQVGESFRRWPRQTRFITPSFHSNPFGLADLNAVNTLSSPAIFSGAEHLSGEQYANYLAYLAASHELPIISGCKVLSVKSQRGDNFILQTEKGQLSTSYLIWATGEYQFPDLTPFPGAQWCRHYAQITDWENFKAADYTVIGGYESGIDATVNLIRLGYHVRLLVRKSTWSPESDYDPSLSLSPYSRERLYKALDTGRLEIIFDANIVAVKKTDGGFRIHAASGLYWDTVQPPVLGTGFLNGGGAQQIAELWQWSDEGRVLLTEADESTRTPGLFLIGPQVRHDKLIYCFIYKFRQRFELIACNLAQCLDLDHSTLQNGSWGPFGNSECCEGCEC